MGRKSWRRIRRAVDTREPFAFKAVEAESLRRRVGQALVIFFQWVGKDT